MNNKKTVLLVISLISLAILVFSLNELYFLIPSLRTGVFNRYSKNEFDNFSQYDLSDNRNEIKILCYLGSDVERVPLMECFNKEEVLFENVGVDFEGYGFSVNFDWKEIADSVQILSIDFNNDTVGILREEKEESLVSILEQFVEEDFILDSDEERNEVYIDMYDYLSVKVSLIDYYSDANREDEVEEILKDMNLFFENFFEKGYVPFKPVSIDDIEKLKEFDLPLATRIVSLSTGGVEYIYQDYLYRVTGRALGGDIDQSILPLLVDIYKVQQSEGLYEEEEELYSKIFDLHQENLMGNFGGMLEEVDIIVRYFPVPGALIQNYLCRGYLEDMDFFVTEVSRLTSYIFKYSTVRNKYPISNLLQYSK